MKTCACFFVCFVFSAIQRYPLIMATSLSTTLTINAHNRILSQCKKSHSNIGEGCATELDLFWNCWPSQRVNDTVEIPCNSLFFKKGTQYGRCETGGKWIFHRENCKDLRDPLVTIRLRNNWLMETFIESECQTQIKKEIKENEEERYLYELAQNVSRWVRYVNLIVCCLSLILILWLVPFKVKRFTLHRFLILGLIMSDIFNIRQEQYQFDFNQQSKCTNMYVVATYFYLAVLLMMFSEGFYQFRQFYFVIVTNYREPSYVIASYTLAAIFVFGVFLPGMYYDPNIKHCWKFYFWSQFRWVLNAAIIIILLLNFMTMVYMMVLISSKLKTDRRSKIEKTKRGIKGFLTLVFMLGFCYAITYLSNSDVIGMRFFVAIVQPSQGIWICLFQVILSRQISKALRKKVKRFNESKRIERSFSSGRGRSSG